MPKNNIVDLKPTNRGNYMSEKTDKKSEKSNSEECKGHCHDSDESCKNESKKPIFLSNNVDVKRHVPEA